MDTLTKMMGLYLDNGGKWSELESQFLFNFPHENLETDKRGYSALSISR